MKTGFRTGTRTTLPISTFIGPMPRERAATAVRQAGITPATGAGHLGYETLVGSRVEPSPMQEWARNVPLPDGPTLFIVETRPAAARPRRR